jgi:hypothetical protein
VHLTCGYRLNPLSNVTNSKAPARAKAAKKASFQALRVTSRGNIVVSPKVRGTICGQRERSRPGRGEKRKFYSLTRVRLSWISCDGIRDTHDRAFRQLWLTLQYHNTVLDPTEDFHALHLPARLSLHRQRRSSQSKMGPRLDGRGKRRNSLINSKLHNLASMRPRHACVNRTRTLPLSATLTGRHSVLIDSVPCRHPPTASAGTTSWKGGRAARHPAANRRFRQVTFQGPSLTWVRPPPLPMW